MGQPEGDLKAMHHGLENYSYDDALCVDRYTKPRNSPAYDRLWIQDELAVRLCQFAHSRPGLLR